MINSREVYFKKITNTNNVNLDAKRSGLSGLKSFIETTLQQGSPFTVYLSSLSIEDKSRLLHALITNNTTMIEHFLLNQIVANYPSLQPEALKYITELSRGDNPDEWLSTSVRAIIKTVFSNCDDIAKEVIISKAMKQIPDTEFSILAKWEITNSMNVFMLGDNPSLTFGTQSDLKKDNNKYTGNISEKEYYQIIKNKSLDISEFIVSTIGVLQTVTPKNDKSAEDLNKVRKLYDQLEYVRAVDALKKFCITYSVKPDLTIRITNKSSDWVMPTMNKNYARRFYETRVAQLGIADIDLAKANKVSMAITGISAANLDDISTITLAAEARREKRFFDRMDKLTDLSYRYKKRIRTKKEGMMSTKREISNAITGDEASNVILSKNTGVMVSNQPNFAHVLTEKNLRNRAPDRNIGGYRTDPADKSHVGAYAADISGHFFYLVALLEDYMQKRAHDPSLESDVNNYIKAIMIEYINQGYHSYLEIVEVFNDPYIKQIFDSYHVKLDLNWNFKAIEQATRDTQDYTKTICLKKTLHTELEPAYDIHVNKIIKEQLKQIQRELGHYLNKQSVGSKLMGKTQIINDAIYELGFLQNDINLNPNPDVKEINKKCHRIITRLKEKNLELDKKNKGGKLGRSIERMIRMIDANQSHVDNRQKNEAVIHVSAQQGTKKPPGLR